MKFRIISVHSRRIGVNAFGGETYDTESDADLAAAIVVADTGVSQMVLARAHVLGIPAWIPVSLHSAEAPKLNFGDRRFLDEPI